MQGNGPRVSVVMSVHNGAGFVRQAVDSVLMQTFSDLEFIILDDGSNDATPAILREAAAEDHRITVVTQEHMGLPRSRNRAIMMTTGEFVALHDADDVSLPQRLAKQVEFLERHPEHGIVGCSAELIDETGAHQLTLMFPVEHDELRKALFESVCFVHGSLMIRRTALQAVGGYRIEFPLAEDYDLYFRISERFRVATLPEVLYHYRKTVETVSFRRGAILRNYAEIAKELALQRLAEGKDILMLGGQHHGDRLFTPVEGDR